MALGSKLKIAVAGVAAALVLITASAASGGTTQALEFTNTGGAITLATQTPLPLPAGAIGVTGDWNTTTGDFTGELTGNPIPSTVDVAGNAIPITVQIVALDDLAGSIDPADGVGEIDTSVSVVITILLPAPAAAIVCTLGPINGTFFTDITGGAPLTPNPFEPDAEYAMTLVMDDAPIPALADGDCSAPGIAATVNTQVGLPGTAVVTLPLVRGTAVPPTTPTTSASTSTTAAPAATTTPHFTG